MNRYIKREWTTPLIIGSFAISAVTGILVFFHLNIGWVKDAHTWFSWLLVVGAAAHIMTYWDSMVQYFKHPVGQIIIAACLIVTLASFLPLGGGKKPHPFAVISNTLAGLSLREIAMVVKKSPPDLMADLQGRHLVVDRESQTVAEIAKLNDKRDVDVLTAIFGGGEGKGRPPRR